MLFLIFVDGLKKEIESKVSSLPSLQLNGLLFADGFVGLSDSKEGLQGIISVVHAYSKKWCFEANVTKSAVVVFRNEKTFDGEWFWGNSALPHLDNYKYLGVKLHIMHYKNEFVISTMQIVILVCIIKLKNHYSHLCRISGS